MNPTSTARKVDVSGVGLSVTNYAGLEIYLFGSEPETCNRFVAAILVREPCSPLV